MPRIVHFEIPADNPDRAAKFYSKVLGWKFEKWPGPQDYWMITTGPDKEPGINGGMVRRGQAFAGVVNTVEVPSVDDYVKNVTANGGKTVMSKMTIPGVGYAAYCADTEGNKFGLFQTDASAK